MTGKKYSAGAIFLQVVPVFANVQNAIADEAKNIDRAFGDQMEKSGEKAGDRAGKAAAEGIERHLGKASKQVSADMERGFQESIKGLNKALGDVDTKSLSDRIRGEIRAMRKELDDLGKTEIKVDADVRQAEKRLGELADHLGDMQKDSKFVLTAEGLPQVYRKLTEVKRAINDIDGTIDLDVDTRGAERKMGAFERNIKATMAKASRSISTGPNRELNKLKDELDYLGRLRVGIDIGATQLRREIGEIMADLKRLSMSDPEIDVKFDAGRAWAELAPFQAAMDRIDGRDVRVDAHVDTHGATRDLGFIARSGDDAANSFRSFNAVLLIAAGAGPALVPVLGAIAGGLLAIGPAAAVAGAGLGSVLVGFSGIGDAVQALQARQDQAAMTSQGAARKEISSANAVADARRSAARSIESALKRQKDAQESYAESIQDVKDAEQALREARENARGTGDDIKDQIKANNLAIDQAMLDEFNTTVTYNSVLADGSATNAEKEQARIDMEQAKLNMKELRDRQKELAEEKKKWDQEGINGTEQVKNAQDHLNDSIDAQRDAYDNLQESIKGVTQAREDGARQIAAAIQSQADAMSSLNAQQNAVDQAFNKLGPEGRQFALFIQSLKEDFYDLREAIQAVLLPQVQGALMSFFDSEAASIMRDALIGLADGFGQFTRALSSSMQGDAWTQFFEMLNSLGPDIQAAYGQAFISFLEAMASILTTLAPYALDFANGLAALSDRFADWAASEKGQESIQGFMDYIEGIAPSVLDLVGSLVGAFANLARGLADWGEVTLSHITDFLDFLSAMDPKILSAIVVSLLVLITASQTAYGVMNLLLAGGALLTSTVGAWVFGIVAVILALGYLYKTNDEFRGFIQDSWGLIKDAFEDAWESIEPALRNLGDSLMVLWEQALQPFFEWVGPKIVWLATKIIPLLGKWFALQVNVIAWIIENIWVPILTHMGEIVMWTWSKVIKPVWNAMAKAGKWLWEKVLGPSFNAIGDTWKKNMRSMQWTWDHVLGPVFNFITDTALPGLLGAFETTLDAISTLWDGLKRVVGAPIKFVLDTIINEGLIDGFNKIAGWVGQDGFKHIPIPKAIQKYATGGVMPGYTPGRDVHSFVSPTAGRLELSGGEAIMRPEWTAAMGSDYVNAMNGLAARGGVNAIRQAMAYAKGGIFFPLPGAHPSTYPGHDGVDLNVGSGAADLGMPYYSATPGRVSSVGYGRGYGNAVFVQSPFGELVYGHSMDGSIRVGVGQSVKPGTWLARVGSTGNSSAPHLHFGFPGGSYASALALLQGAPVGEPGKPGEGGGMGLPGSIKGFIQHPISTIKGWVTKKWGDASDAVSSSPIFGYVKRVPLELAHGIKDKALDMIPGWAKSIAGGVGDVASGIGDAIGDAAGAVGGALGLKTGGILPYNGTMMYDNGGYLPPGLTSVVNLTGKPEPVFTADQFEGIDGPSEPGGNIHYEPHFEGSDLTANDVAGDLNFTFRRLRRAGKYATVGDQ